MAKAKGKVNKSQMVRDILEKDPGIKANDVLAKMKEQGQTITPNQVYFIMGKAKGAKKRKKQIVKAAMATSTSNGVVVKADALTMIREVKALAAKAGGYKKLKDLVDALPE